MTMMKDVTVLIVDDNVDFHTVATATFRRRGYHVKSLYEGPTEQVRKLATDCDVILLDVDLPGESGVTICKHIKSDPQCVMIPIILITGNADIDALCLELRADAWLVKPFSSTALISEVERLLIQSDSR